MQLVSSPAPFSLSLSPIVPAFDEENLSDFFPSWKRNDTTCHLIREWNFYFYIYSKWRIIIPKTEREGWSRLTSDHTSPITILHRQSLEEKRGEEEEKGDWRNWTRGAEGVGWRWGSTRRLGRLTYVRIVPRELTGEIKRGRGRGKWENTPADTEADAANDSVRGNLLVLSVLATWGPTYFESRTCTRFHSLVSRLPAPIPHRCFYSIQFDRSSFPSVQANVSPIEKTLPTNGRQIKKRKDGKVYKRTSHLRMPEDSKTGGKEEEEKETLPLPLRNPCAPQTNRAQLPYVRSLSNPRAISQLLNPQSEKGRLERRRRAPSLSPARVSARRGAVDDVEPGRQTLSSPERETCLPFCKIGWPNNAARASTRVRRGIPLTVSVPFVGLGSRVGSWPAGRPRAVPGAGGLKLALECLISLRISNVLDCPWENDFSTFAFFCIYRADRFEEFSKKERRDGW